MQKRGKKVNNNYITEEKNKKFVDLVTKYAKIDPSLYEKYNVKRGLRNADGSGVLVGLTTVGEVTGYMFIDNEKEAIPGRLSYRGREIRDIIASQKGHRYSFEEVIYLLLFSEVPEKQDFEDFCELLSKYRELPFGFVEDTILKCPSNNVMNKMARSVLTLYSYDQDPDNRSIENVIKQVIALIARFSTIAAYGYRSKQHYFDGKSLILHPNNPKLSIAENFLQLIRDDKTYTKLEAETLDLMLILHAEHGGGNNSTFTTHVIMSSGTDVYSAVAAAIGSLKGSRHGGANIKVAEMIEDLYRTVDDITDEKQVTQYLEGVLDKKYNDKTGLIYGMGHAVYTLCDPRTELLREKAKELAMEKGKMKDYNLYRMIEKIAPEIINKKTNKQICANVDLYSGFVYNMLNIPKELFTPLFAISRIAGWSAHILEEIVTNKRIMRPAYKSVSQKTTYIKNDEDISD